MPPATAINGIEVLKKVIFKTFFIKYSFKVFSESIEEEAFPSSFT